MIENGAPKLPESHQRALNWSAVRDEVQDFTRNIRAVSGGGGLVKCRQRQPFPKARRDLRSSPISFPSANSGLSADLDAIATYLAVGRSRADIPGEQQQVVVQKGRELFEAAGCQNCHGGKNWTISVIDYTPPPDATEIVDAQLVRFLCRVGTFDPALFSDGVSNEIRANNVGQRPGARRSRLHRALAGRGLRQRAVSAQRRGADARCRSRERDASKRRVGGVDTLASADDRREVVRFLKSIDRDTEPFPQGDSARERLRSDADPIALL